jgi:broad specificity phosphatase PhoE
MRILLLRHGATDWNLQKRCQGATDLELNEVGCRQAEELARRLKRERINAIYSSPLKRAVQTAALIGREHRLAVTIDERLRELDHGELEGMTFSEIKAARPEFLRAWREKPAELPVPGGEKLVDVGERVWEAMARIVRRHGAEETLVIVSHQFPILSLLCRITGTPLDQYRSFHLDPCGIVLVKYDREEEWSVVQLDGERLLPGS